MLKRARISFGIASMAALFGFSGLLEGVAPIAQTLFYILMSFSALSLLFSLFEEPASSNVQMLEARLAQRGPSGPYQLVLDFGY